MVASGTKTGWTCPKCGRRFQRVNQGHVCEVWTPEAHLAGKPETSLKLYQRFLDLLQACGPYEISVTKTGITFRGERRGFAGATPTADGLRGFLDLTREVNDPRFRNISPYTKRLFVHHFHLISESQLDAQFAEWLCESYAVGQGAHLKDD